MAFPNGGVFSGEGVFQEAFLIPAAAEVVVCDLPYTIADGNEFVLVQLTRTY